MKLKKLSLLIAATVLAVVLGACSGETSNDGARENEDTSVEIDLDESAGSLDDEQAENSASQEMEESEDFAETVVVDNEYCVFTISSIDAENMWGYTWNVYLENKTDKDIMFSLNDVSVNGFMCDPFWATTVTAGMKANEQINWSSEDFETNGIDAVTDISFTLLVYDSNDLSADYLVEEQHIIYPLGEDAVQAYERVPQEGEIVLFDNEYAAMIVTGFDPDNIWGYTMNVYLENKTDSSLMFTTSDVSVNGFMCDPFWAETVAAGKRSNTSISWLSSDFEANGITDVETITLPIRVYHAEDWTADDFVNETFTVNP